MPPTPATGADTHPAPAPTVGPATPRSARASLVGSPSRTLGPARRRPRAGRAGRDRLAARAPGWALVGWAGWAGWVGWAGTAAVVGLVALTGGELVGPTLAVTLVGMVGVALVGLRVLTGRLRTATDPTAELRPAPGRFHVLHLAVEDPEMPGSGDGARRTAEIDRRLAAAGYRMTVVVQGFPGARDRTEHHGDGSLRWVHLGRGAHRLTRMIAYTAGLPFVVRAVEADVVVEDVVAPFSSIAVPWFSPAPTVGVVQWLVAREEGSRRSEPAVRWVERIGVRSHRRLVGVSRGIADALLAMNRRADVAVIGHGVDAEAFRPRRRGEGADVVFVGRLEAAQEGLDLLVDAWARVAHKIDGRLVLAGTGPDESALRERAERHGVDDSVHFAGPVDGDARFDLVANARLAVVPSRVESSGRIVAAEALACGTAVVALDGPGLREVVPPEVGVVVASTGEHGTDVAALATALKCVARCVGLRAQAADRGPSLAAAHGWDALARAQEDVLRDAAGVAPRPHRAASRPPRLESDTTRFPRPVGVGLESA